MVLDDNKTKVVSEVINTFVTLSEEEKAKEFYDDIGLFVDECMESCNHDSNYKWVTEALCKFDLYLFTVRFVKHLQSAFDNWFRMDRDKRDEWFATDGTIGYLEETLTYKEMAILDKNVGLLTKICRKLYESQTKYLQKGNYGPLVLGKIKDFGQKIAENKGLVVQNIFI